MDTKELEEILNYCQDEVEYDSFKEWLQDGGAYLLNEEDIEILSLTDPLYLEQQIGIIEKVALNSECQYIWAVAERFRNEHLHSKK